VTHSDLLSSAIRELDRARTTPDLIQATRSLSTLKDLKAAPKLIEVLSFNNPAVGAVAMGGLIALGPDVVPILLRNLNAHDYGARAWAIRALAELKDPRGTDVLIQALQQDIAPSVRRAAAKGLAAISGASIHSPDRTERCLQALIDAGEDGEWVVRYAVAYGLEFCLLHCRLLGSIRDQASSTLNILAGESEEVGVVRLRAKLALQRLKAS
jgi:phycocyanobilin lyase beta subunit